MFKGIMPVLTLAALACGCGSNNQGKLEGTKWDAQETKKEKGVLRKGELVVEFHKEAALTWKDLEGTHKGKYTLNSGDYVTLEFNEEIAKSKVHRERIQVHDKTMTLSDSKEKIVFDRLEPAAP
jgi:hypothetical protein